jgi:hypothetical protein
MFYNNIPFCCKNNLTKHAYSDVILHFNNLFRHLVCIFAANDKRSFKNVSFYCIIEYNLLIPSEYKTQSKYEDIDI